jgi:prolyl-tRNA synthetase
MSKNLLPIEDYSKWYNELVKADLAENSGVRGCMVIKPYGYAIWEKMQAELIECLRKLGIKMLISIICSRVCLKQKKMICERMRYRNTPG